MLLEQPKKVGTTAKNATVRITQTPKNPKPASPIKTALQVSYVARLCHLATRHGAKDPRNVVMAEAWEQNETIRRSIEIRDGFVQNPKILGFQGRAADYPHLALG